MLIDDDVTPGVLSAPAVAGNRVTPSIRPRNPATRDRAPVELHFGLFALRCIVPPSAWSGIDLVDRRNREWCGRAPSTCAGVRPVAPHPAQAPLDPVGCR